MGLGTLFCGCLWARGSSGHSPADKTPLATAADQPGPRASPWSREALATGLSSRTSRLHVMALKFLIPAAPWTSTVVPGFAAFPHAGPCLEPSSLFLDLRRRPYLLPSPWSFPDRTCPLTLTDSPSLPHVSSCSEYRTMHNKVHSSRFKLLCHPHRILRERSLCRYLNQVPLTPLSELRFEAHRE